MKVNNRIQQLYQYLQQETVRGAQGVRQEQRTAPAQQQRQVARQDRVELSEAARNAENMRVQLRQEEQVRAQRVEQVRRQVQEGTYQVNAKRTAYGMVRENIIDKIVR
ncbi:conserved hypothetical protein [Thermosulfidibacter takaii ABI70S6]|uniref:Negative regulator of flagellin synthesis n=1 Tax=Thermosulfidibacter takaii (strain DSM 17441 / JCM 13301 / NBRC 103674 / ABI70S6) TaxID=1298851 RepID=A0A0S3QSW8_THET7|nr:flagellar biosynthesis anti-sigma factor FlgM [Thermosulfidibacter takaii]BAT71407.1 conserved hypothetical protein [Thermosulfidibacter takaii ABI70S6]